MARGPPTPWSKRLDAIRDARPSTEARVAICAPLAHLGVEIDPDANATGAQTISTPATPTSVLVVQTDEEAIIARHALTLLAGSIG